MTDALITIKTVQSDGYTKNETEIMTEGTFRKIPSGYEINYDDTDATGFEGSKTVLKVLDGKKIEMLRSGDFLGEIQLEPGKKKFCIYGTPYGEMTVGVQSKTVESMLTDIGGKVRAKYSIDINSNLLGDFDILIDVRCRDKRRAKPIGSN